MITAKSQYRAVARSFRRYWRDYGGWRSVLTSPILHLSAVVNLICYPLWISDEWRVLVFALLPNILGFSLGTYALVFSLITSRTRLALREVRSRGNVSYLDELNSLFMHFLVTQVIAILFALVSKSTLIFDALLLSGFAAAEASAVVRPLALAGGFAGSLLLIYALCSISGAAFAVYRLATLVDPHDQ